MRERNLVSIEGVEGSTTYDALDGMVAQETATRVRSALASLSPMQREVFVMRVEQGLAYAEIATVLETTEGAARVHYHNAIRAVKEFLND
jgi:RNA polymerase sigma-70 factor (ECF subfamily)